MDLAAVVCMVLLCSIMVAQLDKTVGGLLGTVGARLF
jgi:hypothetical protein